MPKRLERLHVWLQEILDTPSYTLEAASTDASFRCYFRVEVDGTSYVVMDAPPAQENSQSFVTIAALLAEVGVHVPSVVSANMPEGFLLLEDLGSEHYLDVLDSSNVERCTVMPSPHWPPSKPVPSQRRSLTTLKPCCAPRWSYSLTGF